MSSPAVAPFGQSPMAFQAMSDKQLSALLPGCCLSEDLLRNGLVWEGYFLLFLTGGKQYPEQGNKQN